VIIVVAEDTVRDKNTAGLRGCRKTGGILCDTKYLLPAQQRNGGLKINVTYLRGIVCGSLQSAMEAHGKRRIP
jgi:hypothetical protein